MAGVQTTSFVNPLDPASAIEAQQIQRQAALAAALRQQSMQPIDPGRGAISWTQGLGKLAQAVSGALLQKKADANQLSLGLRQFQALKSMFGGGPVPAAASAAATPPANSAAASDSASNPQPVGDGATGLPGGLAQLAANQGPAGALAPAAPPVAPPAPQAAPPAAAPVPAGVSPASGGTGHGFSLPGMSPEQSTAAYLSMGPQEYFKAYATAYAPPDFTKLLLASGIDPQGPLGRQLTAAQIAKQNYTAPINGRPGATIRDPYDPSRVLGYDLPTVQGAIPQYGPHGEALGYVTAPGAAQATEEQARANALGHAAGDLVQTFNPQTGQMEYTPKTAVLGAGQPGASGAPGGGAYAASAPPGFEPASEVTGKQSAQAYQAVADSASDAPNRIYALNNMRDLVRAGLTTGPGAGWSATALGSLNRVLPSWAQVNPSFTSNAQEFQKWGAQVSSRYAAELGLSGSDKRTELAIHATPNMTMTPQAIEGIVPQMIGFETAKLGRATAANAYQQSHGPQSYQQFSAAWNANYDPRIYTWLASGTVKQNMATLKRTNPADYNALVHKATVLGQLGAIPQ